MSVYACSDFHGHLEFYKAIKDFVKPEDKVFFLGDAGDRGPEPWETIKAVAKDPQFVYIKGNHEDMLVDAIKETIIRNSAHGWRLLVANGGADTFDQAMQEEDPMAWADLLNDCPTLEEYVNTNGEHIYLCHAGFTPWLKEDGGIKAPNPKGSDLIWDRDHYLETTSKGPWGNVIVVHGHTPIPYIWEDLRIPKEDQEMGALWYNANKVCIDTGAHWTKHTVLLNLDNWEEHIFQN